MSYFLQPIRKKKRKKRLQKTNSECSQNTLQSINLQIFDFCANLSNFVIFQMNEKKLFLRYKVLIPVLSAESQASITDTNSENAGQILQVPSLF